jgi:hypothetical protein
MLGDAGRAVPIEFFWDRLHSVGLKTPSRHASARSSATGPGRTGGERSDHFASHLRLQGRRLTAAFLLKGAGQGFRPMHMTHLGKRGDRLFRLASEPAELLVVQHCHEITPPVRATLRALAVQPHQAPRYCLIDGRDSFRLLAAYGFVEKALQLSAKKS